MNPLAYFKIYKTDSVNNYAPYLYRLDRKEIGTEIIAKINREGYLQ